MGLQKLKTYFYQYEYVTTSRELAFSNEDTLLKEYYQFIQKKIEITKNNFKNEKKVYFEELKKIELKEINKLKKSLNNVKKFEREDKFKNILNKKII